MLRDRPLDRLRYWKTRKAWRFRYPNPQGGEIVKIFGPTGVKPDDKSAYAEAVLECRAWLADRSLDQDRGEQTNRERAAERADSEAQRRAVLAAKTYREGKATREEAIEEAVEQINQSTAAAEELGRLRTPQIRLLRRIEELEPRARRADLLELEVERLRAENEQLRSIVAATGRAMATENGPLSELVSKFCEAKSAELKAKGRLPKTMTPIRSSALGLVDWLSNYSPPIKTSADLDACPRALADYRDEIVEQLEAKSAGWARKQLDGPRQFTEFMLRRGYLGTMPRSIGRDWLSVGKDDPSPTFLSASEIRTLLAKAPDDRIKLALLMGLNCAYRESDIVSLKAADVDLKTGEIKRTRNKTGALQCHRLWAPTLALLKPYVESGDEYPLASYNRISLALTSYIDSALVGNADLPYGQRRTAKSLRSTAAQLVELETSGESPHLVSQMLGHADHSMSKHYRRANFTALFEVIDKIGTKLEVDRKKARPCKA